MKGKGHVSTIEDNNDSTNINNENFKTKITELKKQKEKQHIEDQQKIIKHIKIKRIPKTLNQNRNLPKLCLIDIRFKDFLFVNNMKNDCLATC